MFDAILHRQLKAAYKKKVIHIYQERLDREKKKRAAAIKRLIAYAKTLNILPKD